MIETATFDLATDNTVVKIASLESEVVFDMLHDSSFEAITRIGTVSIMSERLSEAGGME